MNAAAPRSNVSSLLAACIVAAALIASALIVTHRPMASSTSLVPVLTPTATPAVAPPIAQPSAQEQFRAQVLAAPSLHTFLDKGKAYTLADVKVKQVTYSAKDDTFTIFYDWTWQPGPPPDNPQNDSATLSNDGYGHYYGTVVLSPIVGGSGQNADVTIK